MIRISVKQLLVFIAVSGLLMGLYFANNLVKSRGFSSLFSFIKIVAFNATQGKSADLELTAEIKPKHFKEIEAVRDAALERGVIIQPEDPYVPCELTFKGEKIKGEIRLKGKMTDHVSGKKWSFRVKTKKNDAFMGMQRFTLQHPGTRGYVYEWLHHQLCKREGIIALRYEFINLTLNGEDLGIYAVEENFGQPLVQNNERPKGPVFRFNPTLYWQDRLNAINRVYIAQEFTNFQNAHVEAFSKKESFTDSTLKAAFVDANNLMNKVRWGQISVSDAFDVQKLAKRYALLDLCGGYHSVDWSDVKFYYNPVLKKIEPVAYESFGPRFIYQIIGNYRFNQTTDAFPSDYHDIIFSDSTFFAEYIKALREISAPDYLTSILTELKPELDKRVAIQYSEFPYKNFSFDVFEHNLTTIRNSLEAPKNFHAYLVNRTDSSVILQLQGIESLPSEILGITISNQEFLLTKPSILESLQRDHKPIFKTISIPVDGSIQLDTERGKDLSVIYRLLGDTVLRSCEVFPYSIDEYAQQGMQESKEVIPTASLNFFSIDSASQTYFIKDEDIKISQVITIPENWTLRATSPLNIEFAENGGFVVDGAVEWKGQENNPIKIQLNTNEPYWLKLMGEVKASNLSSIQISGKANSTGLIYGSSLMAENVQFENAGEHNFEGFNSKIIADNCIFSNASQSALKLSFCQVNVQNSRFSQSERGIDAKGGELNVENSIFIDTKVAIESKRKEKVSMRRVTINNAEIACLIQDAASLVWTEGEISNSILGFKVFRKGNLYAPAQVKVENLIFKNVESEYLLESENKLEINGKEVIPNKK